MNFLLKKTTELFEKPEDTTLNVFDLDYRLIEDPDDPYHLKHELRGFVKKSNDALLVSYKMWLNSKRFDYIREPGFGGHFYNLLRDVAELSVDNESNVEEFIRMKTAENFPLLNLIDVKATANVTKHNWTVRIIVQDKVTDMLLTDTVEVDQYEEDE